MSDRFKKLKDKDLGMVELAQNALQPIGAAVSNASGNLGSAIDRGAGRLFNEREHMPDMQQQRRVGEGAPSRPSQSDQESSDRFAQMIAERTPKMGQPQVSPEMKQRFDMMESASDFGGQADPADMALMKERDPQRFMRLFGNK